MTDHDINRIEPEPKFSFGVGELRHARAAATARMGGGAPLAVVEEDRGFDPYNTSGGFDRKNNWARVRKR